MLLYCGVTAAGRTNTQIGPDRNLLQIQISWDKISSTSSSVDQLPLPWIYLLSLTFFLYKGLLGQNESGICKKMGNVRLVSLLQMHCIVSYLHIWPLIRATFYYGSWAAVFVFVLEQLAIKQARKLQATLVRNYDSLADGGEV